MSLALCDFDMRRLRRTLTYLLNKKQRHLIFGHNFGKHTDFHNSFTVTFSMKFLYHYTELPYHLKFSLLYNNIFRTYLQSPDCACGVNAWSTKQIWVNFIPIKRCKWCTKVRILVLQKNNLASGMHKQPHTHRPFQRPFSGRTQVSQLLPLFYFSICSEPSILLTFRPIHSLWTHFYSAMRHNARIASAVSYTNSVCPSVRHTPVLCQNNGM